MGRYIRDIYDKEEEFLAPIYFFALVALVALLFIALLGGMDTDLKSEHADEKNDLYLALQGKETNSTKALATAQIVREMNNGNFNDWSYFGSLIGDQGIIDNDHSSVGFAILNWNETVEYLEDPDKAIPENHIWGNAIDWYFWAVGIIFVFAVNLGYIFGAASSELSDVYKYPWKEKWALPWAIPLMPYILLTQPFVLLYMIIREPLEFGYRAIIAWNDHLESVQVRSTITSTEEPEPVSEPEPRLRSMSFEKHSDYVRSEDETSKLERKFEKIIGEVIKNTEDSKKNFEIFCTNVLKREIKGKESLIIDFKKKLSDLGLEIEKTQRKILNTTKQKEMAEKAIASVDPEKTGEEFEKILSLPLVAAIEIPDESYIINIYTKKIFIDYNGKRFEIGNFLITLNMAYCAKGIRNLTNTTNYDRHHPYNSYDFSTSFCFGKTNSVISEALGSNDILLATTVILQALQTGGGDSTSKIDYWRKVKRVK